MKKGSDPDDEVDMLIAEGEWRNERMQWIVPGSILLFVLAVHVLLDRYYARWSQRMKELERRNAEMVERLRRQREERGAL
ncbi:MAG: hypothetical protein ACRD21_18515 [Vicinamibacteria bacterium]